MGILSDIQRGAAYQGNSTLGGGIDQLLELDYKPLQQLAQYTYLYNKSQYDQRQKDADEAIVKLAKLTDYDLSKARDGKDKEVAKEAFAKLWDYKSKIASRGTPTSPQEKLKWAEEDARNTNELTSTLDAIIARGLAYDVNKNELLKNEQGLSASEIETEIKALDDLYNKTDYKTKIPALPKFKIPEIQVSKPPVKTVSQIVVSDEGVTDVDHTFFDVPAAKSLSFADVNGMIVTPLKEGATDAEKAEYRAKVRSTNKVKAFKDIAEVYNIAFNDPKYKKTITTTDINVVDAPAVTKLTNEIDLEKIKSNPLLQEQQELITRYNNWAAQKKADVLAGKYKDRIDPKTGLVVTISADEFTPIDPTKPLKPEDLAFLEKFRLAAPDKVEKKYTNTGLGTQRKNIELDYKVQKQNADTAWYNAHKGDTPKGESPKFMDLTGYTGTLTTADIAAIDPNLVVSENGVLKLTPEGQKASFKILDNGDVEINYNNGKPSGTKKDGKKEIVTPEVKSTIKIINKDKYQKESVTITQTVLKDRKGEEGNPFTFTGLGNQTKKPDVSEIPEGTMAEWKENGWTEKEIKDASKAGKIKVKN